MRISDMVQAFKEVFLITFANIRTNSELICFKASQIKKIPAAFK